MRGLDLIPQKGHAVTQGVIIILLSSCFGITMQQDEPCTDAGDYCITLRADECYYNDEFCCKSCKKFAADTPTCKYGDRATVCTDEYCFFTWNLELCCHTCRMNLTSTTTTTTTMATTRGTTTVPLVETNATTTTVVTSPTTKPCFDGLVNGIACDKYVESKGKRSCYRYEDVCCTTCSRIRENTPSDCPYGDKMKWCKDLSREQCYANNATCCDTCETLKTNISGCQFGDSMPSYCSTLLREDCYEESVFCCDTCNQFIQPGAPPGCEYGDKMETKQCLRRKRNGNCGNARIKRRCCKTCGDDESNKDDL